MKLKYVGPFEAVRVPLPGGGEATVERGDVLETTDTHGKGMLDQPDNWEKVTEKPSKGKD